MASPYDDIPDEIKEQVLAANSRSKLAVDHAAKTQAAGGNPSQIPLPEGTEKETSQKRLFKKKRAGVVLTKEEVKAIKAGRKKLRKELKARGIKGKRDFEMTAASLGLYFDKRRGLLGWLLLHWLGILIGLMLALLLLLFLFSLVQQMRGHYTVNLSEGMFKEGFLMSETEDFANPTTHLFAVPAEQIPCISITQIPEDVDEFDGEHNDVYFAYTYYIRNEGESTVGYTWDVRMNMETQELSDAAWAVIFEDGVMRFYAKANAETGEEEALPAFDDDTRGYLGIPLMDLDPGSDQFEVVAQRGSMTWYRVIPEPFVTDRVIAMGRQEDVAPGDIHKYTVVLFLEGDDPECTDELIGGSLGVQMDFRLETEADNEDAEDEYGLFGVKWKRLWENMKFW